MDLEKLYSDVKNAISKLYLPELWRGFEPIKFALYSGQSCFFDGQYIEKPIMFCANTAIEYNGEFIAIWNVIEKQDSDILASKMVHEMFHAFQHKQGEKRFPDEFDALKRYRLNAENLSVKLRENMLLVELSERFSVSKYEEFLALRRYRMEHFPYEYAYEAATEQIEGTANYVELMSLRQLSEWKYMESLKSLKTEVRSMKGLMTPRIISYSVGALLFKILKDNRLFEFDYFTDEPTSVSLLKDVRPCENPPAADAYIASLVESHERETKELIEKAVSDGNIEVSGEYDLIGVNIYNARMYGNYIYTTYFAAYSDNGREVVLNGNFVVELNDLGKVIRIYRA